MNVKRYHNIFDMNHCNGNIGDPKIVREFIEKLAEAVDMSILEGPIIAKGIEQNPGLSALAIIDFSHVSIHTFTKHSEVLIDVFSCKEYDRDKVLHVCKEYFQTLRSEIRQKEVWWG